MVKEVAKVRYGRDKVVDYVAKVDVKEVFALRGAQVWYHQRCRLLRVK